MVNFEILNKLASINNPSTNRTHAEIYKDVLSAVESYKKKYQARKNQINPSSEELCIMIEDFASFPLGRHILLTGGANGRWTDYIISPNEQLNFEDFLERPLSTLESFILFHSPVVKAQRELFKLLKKTAQNLLGNGKTFASIPCGVMRDLLSLDYSKCNDTKLVGIDLDPESIACAQMLAKQRDLLNVQFYVKDAWNLQCKSEFDFISSIGLNMYESDQSKVINLYHQLFLALKPGGTLFTGVLTWPPYINSKDTDWILDNISRYDLYLEKVIHKDLLDIKWFNFRKLSEIRDDFEKAGFSHIKIINDSSCVFPAVLATK
jgi:ubiquinone/menaquinone biosynthesis C-methylase UbiE